MPIRSRRIERALAWLVAALGALSAQLVQAHEPGSDALPETPGWQAGAAVALVAPKADDRWPAAAWPGVLINGSAPRDQRGGLRLEHGTLELAARIDRRFGVHVAAGWHDREQVHTEAANLQARFDRTGDEIEMRLGRDTVRMGAVIDGAGHFDRFSQPPLAKRAVLNDQWIDDGFALAWRRPDADGLRALEAGLWRGRAFPGGPAGPAVPSLHLHAGWGHLDAHLAAAHFQPEARGAAAQSLGTTGHVHGSLDCRVSLQQRVCFDGTVDVVGGSLQWEPAQGDWSVALAGLWRHDKGSLYATSGDARLSSRVAGVWADLTWRPAAQWTLAGRLERLVPDNRLEGIGTVLLSDAAGLTGGGPVERATAAVLFEPHGQVTLSIESGVERFAGGRVSHVALRAMWRNPRWLGGSW
jgi:hypothetical protein